MVLKDTAAGPVQFFFLGGWSGVSDQQHMYRVLRSQTNTLVCSVVLRTAAADWDVRP